MEQLQSPKSPPTPSRHIHSSFPYYFYTTPAAAPSSESISAFVSHCESRTAAPSDTDGSFAFVSDRHETSVADADVLFREGRLLPVAPQPLKPPPRLQFIANLRKSLRNLPRMRKSSRCTRVDGADPFAAAAEKVRKEDAPWCQLPWRQRGARSDGATGKGKNRGIMDSLRSLVPKRVSDARLNKEESAVLIRQSSTSSGTHNNNGNQMGLMSKSTQTAKNENWFFRFLKSAINGKKTSKGGLAYGPSMFACFGFK